MISDGGCNYSVPRSDFRTRVGSGFGAMSGSSFGTGIGPMVKVCFENGTRISVLRLGLGFGIGVKIRIRDRGSSSRSGFKMGVGVGLVR